MRIRAVVAIAALALPAALSAQRIPLPIGRRGGGVDRELPPQPGPIARELAYKRWRLSFESYPLVSYISSPGLAGGKAMPSFMTLGTGTRADYLLTRNISATMDMTSSFIGGPAITNTAELGTRFHPQWAEHRLFPYADLRVAYLSAYDRRLAMYGGGIIDPTIPGRTVVRYSTGFGASAGAGAEYSLTARWSIFSGASLLHTRLRAEDFETTPANMHFGLTALRYTIGIHYNPIRIIQSPIGTDVR